MESRPAAVVPSGTGARPSISVRRPRGFRLYRRFAQPPGHPGRGGKL